MGIEENTVKIVQTEEFEKDTEKRSLQKGKRKMTNIKTILMLYMIDAFAYKSLKSYSFKLSDEDHHFKRLSSIVHGYTQRRIRKIKVTKKQKAKIMSFLASCVDVEIEFLKEKCHGKSSPQMLMLIAVDRLANIIKDKDCESYFKVLNLSSYFDYIFTNKSYQQYFKDHNDFLDKVLNKKINERVNNEL